MDIGLRGVMSSFFPDGTRAGKSSLAGLMFAVFELDIAPMVYLAVLEADMLERFADLDLSYFVENGV